MAEGEAVRLPMQISHQGRTYFWATLDYGSEAANF